MTRIQNISHQSVSQLETCREKVRNYFKKDTDKINIAEIAREAGIEKTLLAKLIGDRTNFRVMKPETIEERKNILADYLKNKGTDTSTIKNFETDFENLNTAIKIVKQQQSQNNKFHLIS